MCKILFVPSKSGICFPQFCGIPMIKSPWPSKSDFLGIPIPFAGSPGCKARYVAQSLHNSSRISIVLFFSSFRVIHSAGIRFDYIMIAHLLLSHWSFSFVFECGVSFFGGFQFPPVHDCSNVSCDFVSLMSFYSTILTQTPWKIFYQFPFLCFWLVCSFFLFFLVQFWKAIFLSICLFLWGCSVYWNIFSHSSPFVPENKASGNDRIPVEIFQILKDDAVTVLHAICQQNWKT